MITQRQRFHHVQFVCNYANSVSTFNGKINGVLISHCIIMQIVFPLLVENKIRHHRILFYYAIYVSTFSGKKLRHHLTLYYYASVSTFSGK